MKTAVGFSIGSTLSRAGGAVTRTHSQGQEPYGSAGLPRTGVGVGKDGRADRNALSHQKGHSLNDHTWVSELGELARISRLSIAALACCVALVPSLAAAKTYRSLEIKHEFQRQHPGPSTGIS